MTTDQTQIIEIFRDVRFLANASDELLAQLANVSELIQVAPGQMIFRQGDTANSIYLVRSGLVSLEICASGVGCRKILTVGPGELLGWSPALQHGTYTATARASDEVHLIRIDGPQAIAIWTASPQLGYEFMKLVALALAKRINTTRIQLLNVYGSDMPDLPDAQPQGT